MTVSAQNSANAGMFGISVAFTVFTIIGYEAYQGWRKRKTGIVQIMNFLQIFIEWYSYSLAIIFRFYNFTDFNACNSYRIFINISYYFGFTLFIEIILLLKARALFPNPRNGLILQYGSAFLILIRFGLGILNIVNSPASLSPTGVCFSTYDPFWNEVHSLYRVSLDLLLAILFVVPVMQHVSELPQSDSFAYLFYSQLLRDGVVYPMISFSVVLALQIYLTFGGADANSLTQFIFAIMNLASSVSVHLMVKGVKRAADKSREKSERSSEGRSTGRVGSSNAVGSTGLNGTPLYPTTGNGGGSGIYNISKASNAVTSPTAAGSAGYNGQGYSAYNFDAQDSVRGSSSVKYPPPANGKPQYANGW
ncbi:hypothetical protein HDU76_001667 [Blyttiomyces sp. JEL0837]|nr:hypothetical protein HDU76_001667 [Blyttiomyces sp. JEL0837]